ncbi:ABC transporter permease subunit [Facklamia sp. DSM 111018]|uniref:ABC transporter permease subunit n=1 Tax=Facklamia lactis TaxID=2749967 RepID=A0ABS0LNQ5_9LACT|nr:ABC transporter permease subunit [Facklamia lactis]MBG9985747.1 ABC transporter permease subunit [Facklamia lactis]
MNSEMLSEMYDRLSSLILPATWVTIELVMIVVVIGMVGALAVGLTLYYYAPNGLKPHPRIYSMISLFVNLVRSIPILILIIALSPVVRTIVGTSIGPKAVIIPLILACTANIGRYLENSFRSINPQTIEAARSYGASDLNIIKEIVIKESIPSIISATTIAFVNNIAGSTIAGAVGGGGIGSVAINYGYQSFDDFILYSSVVILFFMVQIVQTIGNKIYDHSMKK